MSHSLKKALREEERPRPSLRREMVRVVVDDIMKVVKRPGKKDIENIAHQIVSKYPKSFKDVIDGECIGKGHDSLLRQLVNRVENNLRPSPDFLCGMKRLKKTSENSDNSDIQLKVRKTDMYGCINYLPKDFPDGETQETLTNKKETLKALASRGQGWSDNISRDQCLCYILQRKDIVEKGLSVTVLLDEWPYLFNEKGINQHFENLLGFSPRTVLESSLEKTGKKLLDFLLCPDASKIKDISSIRTNLKAAKEALGSDQPEIPAIVMLIMKYFNEEWTALFLQLEVTLNLVVYPGSLP